MTIQPLIQIQDQVLNYRMREQRNTAMTYYSINSITNGTMLNGDHRIFFLLPQCQHKGAALHTEATGTEQSDNFNKP